MFDTMEAAFFDDVETKRKNGANIVSFEFRPSGPSRRWNRGTVTYADGNRQAWFEGRWEHTLFGSFRQQQTLVLQCLREFGIPLHADVVLAWCMEHKSNMQRNAYAHGPSISKWSIRGALTALEAKREIQRIRPAVYVIMGGRI